MPGKGGMEFMIAFVREYLDGKCSRMDFDLDFNNYLIENYPKMERQNAEIADCFYFYLAEEGLDKSDGLSDSAHRKLIKKQLAEFESAMRDGIY